MVLQPEQQELLDNGGHYLRVVGGLSIIGIAIPLAETIEMESKTYDLESDEDREAFAEARQSITDYYEEGMFLSRAYSAVEPGGEMGFMSAGSVQPITEDEYQVLLEGIQQSSAT